MKQETCSFFFFPATLSEHNKLTKVKTFAKTFTTRITLPSLTMLLFTNQQCYVRPQINKEEYVSFKTWK